MVIGVHTPEFAFEHKKENVAMALKQYNITYPVAQDNDYKTWQAYNNHYWPAHYLIDQSGDIREVHFGEGGYEETEKAIRSLLEEKGSQVKDTDITKEVTEVTSVKRTEETYLGGDRGKRLASPEEVTGEWQHFSAPLKLLAGQYAFIGQAKILNERTVMQKESEIRLSFQGGKVFLVMSPEGMSKSMASIYIDVLLL